MGIFTWVPASLQPAAFYLKNSVLQTTSGIFASGGVVANCEQKHYSPRYVFEHENFDA